MLVACSAGRAEVRAETQPSAEAVSETVEYTQTAFGAAVTVMFEAAEVDVIGGFVAPRGLRPRLLRPVRGVEVEVALPDGSYISTRLDAAGHLMMEPDWVGAEVHVIARTGGKSALAVDDCPWPSCKGGRNLWAASFVVEAQHLDGGDVVIPANAPAAGAFAALDAAIDAAAFAAGAFDADPPPLTLRWLPQSDTQCGTTCFVGGDAPHIDVLGLDEDSDHFDRQIVMHEYGHFVEDLLVGGEPVGGYHDGTPTEPRLAWSEGFATWFATAASGSDIYVDSHRDGAAWYNYGGLTAIADSAAPPTQPLSEDLVVELLQRLEAHETLGHLGLLAATAGLGARRGACDLGAHGVDLVDLLDVVATTHGSEWVVDAARMHGVPFRFDEDACATADLTPPSSATIGAQSPITPASIGLRYAANHEELRVDVRARAELIEATLTVERRGSDGEMTAIFEQSLGVMPARSGRSVDVAASAAAGLLVVRLDWTLSGGSRGTYVASTATDRSDPGAWSWHDTSVIQTPTRTGIRTSRLLPTAD